LAYEINITDVDAQLQGCCGNERFELAALEAALGIEAQFLGHAAVMGGNVLFAYSLRQMPGNALGMPAGVDKHQRRAVLADELRQAIVDFGPGIA
jgi:hypothetical protein